MRLKQDERRSARLAGAASAVATPSAAFGPSSALDLLPPGLLESRAVPLVDLLDLLSLRCASSTLRAAAEAELERRPKLLALGKDEKGGGSTLVLDLLTMRWAFNVPPPHPNGLEYFTVVQQSPIPR